MVTKPWLEWFCLGDWCMGVSLQEKKIHIFNSIGNSLVFVLVYPNEVQINIKSYIYINLM